MDIIFSPLKRIWSPNSKLGVLNLTLEKMGIIVVHVNILLPCCTLLGVVTPNHFYQWHFLGMKLPDLLVYYGYE